MYTSILQTDVLKDITHMAKDRGRYGINKHFVTTAPLPPQYLKHTFSMGQVLYQLKSNQICRYLPVNVLAALSYII